MDTTATAASATPSTSRSEHPCAPVVAAFPQRFAEALPALRYFAFSATRPLPLQHCRDPLYSTHHDLHWWRVRPGCSPDKGPVVEPIRGAEGNRVWCAVLDAATQEDVAEVLREFTLNVLPGRDTDWRWYMQGGVHCEVGCDRVYHPD